MGLAHWDDVEEHRRAKGEMDATWQLLGDAAGTVGIGCNRIRIAPGMLSTPPHSHRAAEEVFYVLGGSGLAWQDGDVHEVRERDCVIHRPNRQEHTFVGGDEGLELLVVGTRHHRPELGWLPRSGALLTGKVWTHARADDPWDEEAKQPLLAYGDPKPRPDNILNVDEVELEETGPGVTTAPLATHERSEQAGLHWERLAPGATGSVPHCHSEEEELFVMLDGDGLLELWPSPIAEARGAVREDVPINAGHVVSRPPGTRIAHAFRAGANGLTMLIYGTRKPNDIAYYPRSNKLYFRGLGVIGRIESLDYWDEEPR